MGRYPLAVALAATLAAVGAAAPARAATPAGGARALAVSVPADPVPASPGRVAHTLVRVVNPNRAPVLVRITSRSLVLGDNGTVTMGDAPDARWASRLRFPPGLLRIPAQGWRDVRLAIRVPRKLEPDLYFVGFLVTPVATSGSIKVINQIGSFVTMDVPGPRVRRLAGRLSLPWFVLGSSSTGTLHVANTGRAGLRFWGENDLSSWPERATAQDRLTTYLLPAGRSRVLTVTARPRWPIGILTVTTRLVYPGRTESTTQQLVFTRRTIVVSPWVPAVLVALLLGAVASWRVRRWRRRPRRAALAPSS